MIGDVKDLAELLDLGTGVILLLLALVAAIFLWRWGGPRLRRLGHLIDDLAGEPERPGSPRRPGVMERLQEVEDRTGELVRNSGTTMKDALDRLETRSARHDGRMEALDQRLHRIETRVCRGKQEG